MDLERVPRLEHEIRQGLRKAFPGEAVRWEGLLAQRCMFAVGTDRVWISLQDVMNHISLRDSGVAYHTAVKTGRHRVCVGPLGSRRSFYENKRGWFPITSIVEAAKTEFLRLRAERMDAELRGKLQDRAEQEAKRLRGHYGTMMLDLDGVWINVTPAQEPGKLSVKIENISVSEAQELLESAKRIGLLFGSRKDPATLSAWKRLESMDA